MKKVQTIRFPINTASLHNKKLFMLYKQLLKKKALTRFCREAFIEKAERHLSGSEPSYAQLNHCIRTHGIEYVMEAIEEKKNAGAKNIDESIIREIAGKIQSAIINTLQEKSDSTAARPVPMQTREASGAKRPAEIRKQPVHASEGNKALLHHKPDIEKLKALLS